MKSTPYEIEPFLDAWQHRAVEVPHNGTFRVPRYIVRVDIEAEPGYSGTHGWQVRYGPKPWKLYSDTLFGTHRRFGTPAESLVQAQRHLKALWCGNNVRPPRCENATKLFPTGMSGVRILWNIYPTKKADPQVCVRVDALDGKPLITLYAGNHHTFRLAKLKDTIKRAQKLRLDYLKKVGKPLPEVGELNLNKIMLEAPAPFQQLIATEMAALAQKAIAHAEEAAREAIQAMQVAQVAAQATQASSQSPQTTVI